MRWIKEHKLIVSILVILLVLIIVFGVSVIRGGKGNSLTDIASQGMGTVSQKLSGVGTSIKDNITGIFSYKELQQEVKDLEAENLKLKKQLSEAKIEAEQLEELQDLSKILNYSYTKKEFDIVSGDVTSMDGSNWTNIFTINIGTESGIEVGDAVIAGDGLVGKIKDTGEGWSKVVSIIDEDSKVSFKLASNTKKLGVANGSSTGDVSGYMLDSSARVSQGDILITSGLGTYPEGIEIGSVKEVAYNSNTLLKEVTIEPAVDFKCIEKVSVVL